MPSEMRTHVHPGDSWASGGSPRSVGTSASPWSPLWASGSLASIRAALGSPGVPPWTFLKHVPGISGLLGPTESADLYAQSPCGCPARPCALLPAPGQASHHLLLRAPGSQWPPGCPLRTTPCAWMVAAFQARGPQLWRQSQTSVSESQQPRMPPPIQLLVPAPYHPIKEAQVTALTRYCLGTWPGRWV